MPVSTRPRRNWALASLSLLGALTGLSDASATAIWDDVYGPATYAAPALAGHDDGNIHAAVVGNDGHIHQAHSAAPGSWSTWQDLGQPGPSTPFRSNVPPVLRSQNGTLRVFAVATDGGLYTSSLQAFGFTGWSPVIGPGSVNGSFDVAVTTNFATAGHVDIHVVFEGRAGCSYAVRAGASLDILETWPDCEEASIASSNPGEVGIVWRSTNRLHFELGSRLSTGGWVSIPGQTVSREAFSLSNAAYLNGEYHAVFAHNRLVDDVTMLVRSELQHVRYDASTGTAKLHRVASYEPMNDIHALPALAAYRGRLVAAWSAPTTAVQAARWDIADVDLRWVEHGAIGRQASFHAPTLAAFNGRPYIPYNVPFNDSFSLPNYGNDVVAAVTDVSFPFRPRTNILSRSMMHEGMQQNLVLLDVPTDDDKCRNFDEPQGPVLIDDLTLDQRAAIPEIGFNLWMFPEELVDTLYLDITQWLCVMGDPLGWSSQQTPCATQRLPVHIKRTGGIFFCNGIWNNHTDDAFGFFQEFGHFLAAAVGLGDDIGAEATHRDTAHAISGVSKQAMVEGRSLFAEKVGTCGDPTVRCVGFAGIYENYDSGSLAHSFLYTVFQYVRRGETLRQYVYDDVTAGSTLLWRKYQWVRDHIFDGREFLDGGAVANL